jgi:hypothetical protein
LIQHGGSERTFEDTDGGGEVVDAAGGLEGSGEDLDGGDEIVGEAVVQVTLQRTVSVF